MSDHMTLARWYCAGREVWTRWVAGYAPSPETRPMPPAHDRLPPAVGVPLPGPVSSGWALDYYRRKQWWSRRTPVGLAMWRFKYRDDLDAGWRLVLAATRFLSKQMSTDEFDCIVPAPSSPVFREYSPSRWLGEKLAETIGKPVVNDLFIRTRLCLPQKELTSVQARKANISAVFKVAQNKKRHITGKRVLLVDDLSRSGYTLAELRRTLHEAGCGKILTFAFTAVGGTRKGL